MKKTDIQITRHGDLKLSIRIVKTHGFKKAKRVSFSGIIKHALVAMTEDAMKSRKSIIGQAEKIKNQYEFNSERIKNKAQELSVSTIRAREILITEYERDQEERSQKLVDANLALFEPPSMPTQLVEPDSDILNILSTLDAI